MDTITHREVIYLALALKARFKCRRIAWKPDAKSWAIEEDFLAGVESVLKLSGQSLPAEVAERRDAKRSITTLTA